MARKLRLEFAGACYHVINRGNYRRDLFRGKGAAKSFVDCLLEAPAGRSAKGLTSVSNGWLAERLGMGKPASVSQFVRRFRLVVAT